TPAKVFIVIKTALHKCRRIIFTQEIAHAPITSENTGIIMKRISVQADAHDAVRAADIKLESQKGLVILHKRFLPAPFLRIGCDIASTCKVPEQSTNHLGHINPRQADKTLRDIRK